MDGKISRRDGEPKVMIDTVSKLSEDDVSKFRSVQAMRATSRESRVTSPPESLREASRAGHEKTNDTEETNITIVLDEEKGRAAIDAVSAILRTCPKGDTRINVSFGRKKIRTGFAVVMPEEVLTALRNIDGVNKIED